MAIKVNGTKIVEEYDNNKAMMTKHPERPWKVWDGNWTFNEYYDYKDKHENDKSKCFKFGPFCGKSSILDIFNDDEMVIMNMTNYEVRMAIQEYENQTTTCPLTLG